jgi:tetratricopeptide (TPR) repeat protein
MRLRLVLFGLVALVVAQGCKTAAPIHPRAIEHNNYCAKYLNDGDLEKAETRCKLALEFNPDYPEPYCNLGLIEKRRGHISEAKELFVKAIHLNQDFGEAHNDLGVLFLDEKSYGKAHDEFVRALKVNPDYVEARYNLALSLMHLKKYDEARKAYRALIESNPNIADPHHDLCAMDIDDGEFTTAVDECKEAIRLDPKYTSAYFNLGNAFMKGGKFCEAQEAYTDCLRVDSENAECRNNVTIANRKCALLDPSLKEATSKPSTGEGGEPGTDAASGLYAAGLKQVNAGLINEARRSFNKCLRKNSQFALCHFQLFKLDQAVANTAAATDDCKKMLKTSGDEQASEREECKTFLSADGAQ